MAHTEPPERRPPSLAEQQQFSALLSPYMPSSTESLADTPTTLGPDDMGNLRLQDEVERIFAVNGLLPPAFAFGDYEMLQQQSNESAVALNNTYELNIPSAFAVHAIASILITRFPLAVGNPEGFDNRGAYFLNQFVTRLAGLVSNKQLRSGADPFLFRQFAQPISKPLGQANGLPPKWVDLKFAVAADILSLRTHHQNLVDEQEPIAFAGHGSLMRHNNKLFEQLRRLERSTILQPDPGQDPPLWHIADTIDMRLGMAAAITRGVDIRPEQWPAAILAVRENVEKTNRAITAAKLKETGPANHEAFVRRAYLGEDGALYADLFVAMPLRPFYQAARKATNYEVFRQTVLQYYFDRSMPKPLVAEAAEQTRQLTGSENPDADREAGRIYHNLLAPRTELAERLNPEDLG